MIGGGVLSYTLFVPMQLPSGSVTFEISEGSTIQQVAKQLVEKGVIRSDAFFSLLFSLTKKSMTVKAGEYTLTAPVSMSALAQILTRGMPRKEKTIRFIEGWDSMQMAEYLEQQGVVSKKEFLNALSMEIWKSEYPLFKDVWEESTVEGFLFPDTYRIFEGATAKEIVKKMLDQFQKKFIEADPPPEEKWPYTFYDTVIMASILEREVKSYQDKSLVADLLHRRVQKGMPLQVDSSINYVTRKNSASVSGQDLDIESPYNTYKYKGLPPTPISNPGLSSIRAAFDRTPNPYWFFLTPPDGTVVYGKTFEEHVRNKQKYLR